jgi:hypothetical protein
VFSLGTNIQLLDQNGNSPLHYSAKFGHLELCKYLIESGCHVGLKNKSNQTAYDLAESHTVRQYLLPLVLVADRGGSAPDNSTYVYSEGYAAPMVSSYQVPGPPPSGMPPVNNYQNTYASTPPPLHQTPPPSHPPQSSYFPGLTSSSQKLPTLSTSTSTGSVSSLPNVPVPTPSYYGNLPSNKLSTAASGSSRVIQPGNLLFPLS